jgi:NAD(P)H-hydrate epimerase
VLGLSGSPGKSGAALLLARGALRGGAGLVTLAGLPATADALEQRVHEEMTARLDPDKLEDSLDDLLARTDVVAVGPGLGLDAQARRIVEHVVFRWSGRVVVDADALTLLASRFAELPKAKSRLLLTPHPGELGRLLASSAREIENDRFVALARAVEICQATVVLKGPRTLIGAPGQIPAVNTLASRALATGGSGDVLAGVCAAFSCELDPFQAACAAVQVHGFAGQRWSERTGAERGLVAREIADEIPAAIAGLASARGLLTL